VEDSSVGVDGGSLYFEGQHFGQLLAAAKPF